MERDGVRPSQRYPDAANQNMEAWYPDVQQVDIEKVVGWLMVSRQVEIKIHYLKISVFYDNIINNKNSIHI